MRILEDQQKMRRGMTLMEITVSLTLVGAAVLSIAPLLHGVNRAQQGIDLQRVAQAEATNLLEKWSRLPYDQITPESGRGLVLSEAARHELPQAKLTTDVGNQAEAPIGKRLSIEIQWVPGPERKSPPCRLTTWVYPLPEAKR